MFVEPSIGIAALGISPNELALDSETFGLFFENLVNRDLNVCAGKIGGTVRHYRDRMGLECDHYQAQTTGAHKIISGVSDILSGMLFSTSCNEFAFSSISIVSACGFE